MASNFINAERLITSAKFDVAYLFNRNPLNSLNDALAESTRRLNSSELEISRAIRIPSRTSTLIAFSNNGTVERFFRELGYNLPDEGKVHKPLANYLPLDPRATARISFSELCKGILKFVVDVHATKVHSRKLVLPFDLFKESFENLPPPLLPSNLECFGLIAAHQKQLTLGTEGIVTNYLQFNSKELQAMRKKIGHKFKTNVKYDPENLGYCYVQHPQKLDWMYVPNCHPKYAENLSMLQHRAIREKMKKENISGDKYEAHLRAKFEFIDMWESIVKGKKITRDIKSALHFSQLSSTKALATETVNSLDKKNEDQLITPQNIEVAHRDIPTFTSFILD